MTRVTTTPLAVSADYADALLAARRAKNWLFLFLLLFLLAQIAIFFLVRFDVVKIGAGGQATIEVPTEVDVEETPTTGESPATAPSAATIEPATGSPAPAPAPAQPPAAAETPVEAPASGPPALMAFQDASTSDVPDVSVKVGSKDMTTSLLAWVTNSIVYLGTIFSIVMTIVILLIVLIMLVGRLIGVSHSTSAFIWAVLLALLVFPWQLFYGADTSGGLPPYSASQASSTAAVGSGMDDFRVPGVLYTWGELSRDAKFDAEPMGNAILKWARFVGFPVVALLILFMVQAKSGRAVKFALGEAEVHVDVATTDT
jgi:hypothetical protein